MKIPETSARTIDAEPLEVYEVWLDKTSPGSPWFGVPKVILGPKVDGLFYSMYKIETREGRSPITDGSRF